MISEIENRKSFQRRITCFTEPDQWLIAYAYEVAKRGHDRQKRDEGIRYFEHPRRVALIFLDELNTDNSHLVMGALLHDISEDTYLYGNLMKDPYAKWRERATSLLSMHYHPNVAEIVIAVTNPKVNNIDIKDEAQAELISLKNLEFARDPAKLVKMADRLDNLRSLNGIRDLSKRQRKIEETEKKYLPIFEKAQLRHPQEVNYLLEEMRHAIGKVRLTA